MNNQNFNQTGGFPLETDTLDEMQKSYSIFNAIGRINGNKTIIEGCIQTGQNVSNGIVYVNNEFFEFRGGLRQSKVIILQEEISKPFENGENKKVLYRRYITFGTGIDAIEWSDFKKNLSISEIEKSLVPINGIIMYDGAIEDIPEGYVLCDGQNNTPNLSDRFIVGFNPNNPEYDTIGNKGGEETVKLEIDDLPSHSHAGTTDAKGAHRHTYSRSIPGRGYKTRSDASPHGAYQTTNTSSAPNHTHNFQTNPVGGDKRHENRPPYFVLAYIKRIAL